MAQATSTRPVRTPAQVVAIAVAVVFVAVGVLGFIPGVTTNYEELLVAGHHSQALLFGVFAVSVLHNIVHLLFGVAGLALAVRPGGARAFLIAGGLIYLGLWVYGQFVDKASPLNFVPLNAADDWLHLGLGLGMVGLGVLLAPRPTR